MKLISSAINQFDANDIKKIEQKGSVELDINGKNITLGLEDVEITSQDIEGWLVANQGSLTAYCVPSIPIRNNSIGEPNSKLSYW